MTDVEKMVFAVTFAHELERLKAVPTSMLGNDEDAVRARTRRAVQVRAQAALAGFTAVEHLRAAAAEATGPAVDMFEGLKR